MVTFFLLLFKIFVENLTASLRGGSTGDMSGLDQILSARLQLHVDRLTLPVMEKKTALVGTEEMTDFRVLRWPNGKTRSEAEAATTATRRAA
ncbi:unnamed protein product [Amoebophrya sp. A25]|nr:unnamed protein product [Amoebophrya sp. A25]|eukprot:GSA25T00006524001.1